MRLAVLAVVVGLAACGRVAFDSRDDGGGGGGDGGTRDSGDGGAGSGSAYLKASNVGVFDRFGAAVALSADGLTLAIGAPGEASANGDPANNDAPSAGAVYVFVRQGDTWHLQQYLKAAIAENNDSFGWSVALSADGNTLAVGAPGEDGGGGGPADNSAQDAGAAYVFTRTGTTWMERAYLKAFNPGAGDELGWVVALSADGSTLAAGAPEEASASTGVGGDGGNNNATGAGAAYIYVHNVNDWMFQAYIKATNTDANDEFGGSLALTANGNLLAVGASGEDSAANAPADNSAGSSGAVYVYERAGTLWSPSAFLKSSPVVSGDFFGSSVVVAGDGSFVVASSPGEDTTLNSGAAFVIDHSSSTWTQSAMTKGSPRASDDQLGVSLATDGTQLVAGAPLADTTVANGGGAYRFARSSGWTQQQELLAAPSDAGDSFGESVAIAGTTIAIGASREDSASATDPSNNAAADSGAVYLWY